MNKHEGPIERSFVRWCKARGLMCEKLALVGGAGWPDRCVILPSAKVLWLEFKRERGGNVSAIQKIRAAKLRQQGHYVFFPTSKEEAQEILELVARECGFEIKDHIDEFAPAPRRPSLKRIKEPTK